MVEERGGKESHSVMVAFASTRQYTAHHARFFTCQWIFSTDLSLSGSLLLHRVPLFQLHFENKFTVRNDSLDDYAEESSESQGTEAPSETSHDEEDMQPDMLSL